MAFAFGAEGDVLTGWQTEDVGWLGKGEAVAVEGSKRGCNIKVRRLCSMLMVMTPVKWVRESS